MFKIDYIVSNESKIIQLQFATKRIKIGLLEREIQHAKGAWRHYAAPMTSRDVISLQPATISLVTLCNCFLTVGDCTKETQENSGAQLPYRRCESRMFVIYSSTRDARWLCCYLLSCKIAFFTLDKFSQVAILKLERCSFLHLEAYLFLHISCCLFFLLKI